MSDADEAEEEDDEAVAVVEAKCFGMLGTGHSRLLINLHNCAAFSISHSNLSPLTFHFIFMA